MKIHLSWLFIALFGRHWIRCLLKIFLWCAQSPIIIGLGLLPLWCHDQVHHQLLHWAQSISSLTLWRDHLNWHRLTLLRWHVDTRLSLHLEKWKLKTVILIMDCRGRVGNGVLLLQALEHTSLWARPEQDGSHTSSMICTKSGRHKQKKIHDWRQTNLTNFSASWI